MKRRLDPAFGHCAVQAEREKECFVELSSTTALVKLLDGVAN